MQRQVWKQYSTNQKKDFLLQVFLAPFICYIHHDSPREYSHSLNSTGSNCVGPLICRLFSNEYLCWFWSMIGSLWTRRPNCMYWSMPFYIGDLCILGFSCPRGWGVLESILCGYWGITEFCESQKLCAHFNCQELGAPTPKVVQESTV